MRVTLSRESPGCFLLTMVNNVMVHKMLHETDCCGTIRCLLVSHEPVCELLGHKAVGVRAQMVPPFLNELAIVEPQPWIGKTVSNDFNH